MSINNRLLDYRPSLIQKVTQLINDEKFKFRSNNGVSKVFSRNRVLTFSRLLIHMTMTVKSSLQRGLDRFYRELNQSDFDIRVVTKSAFTQARSKLNPSAFLEMSDLVVESFYETAPYLTFDGMRLLAVDGSTVHLPKHKTVVEEFGEKGYGPNADSMQTLGNCSFLYDTLNLTVLDGQLCPNGVGERTMLFTQMDKIHKGDLLLMDRGYPCIWAFFLLVAKGGHFCARMNESWWTVVKEFAKSQQSECFVEFELPEKDRDKLKDYPEYWSKKLTFRLVCVVLSTGEKEYLCTSLTDTKRYPVEMFKDLYHHRWGIEEAFKLFKERIDIQDFSGKTAISVRQDFNAKLFALNFCAAMAFPIEEKLRTEDRNGRKHPRKLNRTSAIALIGQTIVAALLKGKLHEAIEAFDNITSKTTEVVRTGRSFPRNHKKKRPPNSNYKPL